jgi:hypothetical protein
MLARSAARRRLLFIVTPDLPVVETATDVDVVWNLSVNSLRLTQVKA